ncbi:MAG TPA: hypothetical protein VEK79_18895 [Thermoanaerobaculia bacterium]|nr:hypothetical protein [Thermoanaerobaculia bacterium]
MRNLLSAVTIALFFGCSASAPSRLADSVTDTNHNLLPGTRARGSVDAMLGAIGLKAEPRGEESYFTRSTLPDWTQLQVYNAGSVDRTQSDIRELKRIGLSAAAVASLEASAKIEGENKYRLQMLQIRDGQRVAGELRRLANGDPELRGLLMVPNLRIVTSVEQVFGHDTSAKLNASAGVTANATKVGAYDIALNFAGGATSSDVLKISDGTVIAYRLARLCWSKDASFLTFIVDAPGRDACPPEMVETPNFSASVPVPTGEALQNIIWALADTGSPDCTWRYETLAPECLSSGAYRRCAMEKAVREAKANNCERAYELAMLTQCHDAGAAQTLVATGAMPICNYLKAR